MRAPNPAVPSEAILTDLLLEWQAGGIKCMEITFRTAAAEAAIKQASTVHGMLVGAGTCLTVEQVEKAVAAGAKFIVSPGVNMPVVEHCVENGVALFPGVATPTDIDLAMGYGIKTLKFFPAEAYGGVKTLKAISGPYNMIRFIPTGGISADNLAAYLELKQASHP